MAQWVNRLRNNIFINSPPLLLLCEISGSLHLVQSGLTAGRLVNEIVKIFDLSLHLTKVQHHYSLTNAFQPVFRVKPIVRLIFEAQIFQEAIRFPTNPYY